MYECDIYVSIGVEINVEAFGWASFANLAAALKGNAAPRLPRSGPLDDAIAQIWNAMRSEFRAVNPSAPKVSPTTALN